MRACFINTRSSTTAEATGDMVTLPIAAADTIAFDLPTQFLQKGTNKLVLTAVDEPTGEEQRGRIQPLPTTRLNLTTIRQANFPPTPSPRRPRPPFFTCVRAKACPNWWTSTCVITRPWSSGQVTLAVGGHEFHQPLSGKEFGEQRVEFSVPEFTTPVNGTVTVKINGHSQRFPVTLAPAKKWNLLVVPHIHVDVGYSDYQEKVAEIQSRVLEEAIQLIQEHPDFRLQPGWILECAAVHGRAQRGTAAAALPND